MKLISAILVGCALGAVAAAVSLVSGYGVLAALAAYGIFGMIGTLLVAIINWAQPRPFVRAHSKRKRPAALDLSEAATNHTRS